MRLTRSRVRTMMVAVAVAALCFARFPDVATLNG